MKESYNDITVITPGFKIASGEIERTVLYVYSYTPNFVIYELKETGQISYKTTPDFDDNTHEIALKLDKVETYLGEDKEKWDAYKNTMADIYSLYLSNDDTHKKTAENLLDSVTKEIDYNMFSKIHYLLPCLFAVVLSCLISVSVKSYNYIAFEKGWYTIDYHFQSVLYMMTFGSIGGLLSIAIYIDKHEDKVTRVRWQRVFAGLFRMLIAMLSALIMYILLEAKVVGGIENFGEGRYLYYTLGILAGFSQNLIPDLASKGESLLTGKDNKGVPEVKTK